MAARAWIAGLVPLTLMFGAVAALAQEGDDMAGRTYALANCTECHDVGAGRQKPVRPGDAPEFAAIANARSTTPLGLQVFLNTPHAKMPNFIIAEDDRNNVIAYISSLRRP